MLLTHQGGCMELLPQDMHRASSACWSARDSDNEKTKGNCISTHIWHYNIILKLFQVKGSKSLGQAELRSWEPNHILVTCSVSSLCIRPWCTQLAWAYCFCQGKCKNFLNSGQKSYLTHHHHALSPSNKWLVRTGGAHRPLRHGLGEETGQHTQPGCVPCRARAGQDSRRVAGSTRVRRSAGSLPPRRGGRPRISRAVLGMSLCRHLLGSPFPGHNC